jgi:thioredoxin-related protein
MKTIPALLLGSFLCAALPPVLQAGDEAWLTDMDKALEMAKAEKKAVLIDFTGSDWCGFCIKLDKEVFSTSEFGEFAKKNLVLVKADFPRSKKLPPELKKANEQLQKKYADPFQGYPTIVLVDSTGKKLGEIVGYGGGGPKAYIREVSSKLKKS